MPFPEVKRIIYKRNPLDKVICQLRFPPILKINTELPANFQDKIRKEFQLCSDSPELKVSIPNEIRNKLPNGMIHYIQSLHDNKNYEFSTEDGFWQINLTSNFVSLTCNKYERWENFKEKLKLLLDAFIEIYEPSFFTRVGLRYIDIIKRSDLDLKDVHWQDLLKINILGLLSYTEIGNRVQAFESLYEILLADNESRVKIITSFVEHIKDNEQCYMIDSDFFSDKKIKIANVYEKLDFFNERASRLIQWCITDRLHQAMEPLELC